MDLIFETDELTPEELTRFLILYDAGIGTDREINDTDHGASYVVCLELTAPEMVACARFQRESKMIHLTKKQYESIHPDYRGVWSREDHPDLVGKRTAFENSVQGAAGLPITGRPCTLIFEGIHFVITD